VVDAGVDDDLEQLQFVAVGLHHLAVGRYVLGQQLASDLLLQDLNLIGRGVGADAAQVVQMVPQVSLWAQDFALGHEVSRGDDGRVRLIREMRDCFLLFS
jgi:hypothetical protein